MANQNLPILEKQVKLDNTVGQASFTQSFDNMALTPTALGEFGSQLAITASTTLAQKRGYEAGKNPNGSILPPITATDKAFADAYISQSQVTLGLQASKLMNQGQAELAAAWKLTPDMIASYTKNMSDGLNEIINNAPLQAQPGLAAQFGSSLMSSTGSLNQKMIGQQKQETLQNAALFNNTQLSAIYDASRTGNLEAAEKMKNDMEMRTESMATSGMISPLQAEATKKSSRISLYSGLYSGEAINAFKNKESDQYLADLLDKKPPKGVTIQEWESIAKNVISEVQLQESFQQRNETSLYSEANRLLNEGTLTQDFIAQLKSETTSKPKFNNFMSQVASYQRKNYSQNQKLSSLMPRWNNTDAMALADNKTKDAALIQSAQDIQQRAANLGRTIDDFQAQTEAMSTAGSPVQAYTKIINGELTSGNPDLMLRSQKAYDALNKSNPRVLNNISKNAQAMLTAFELQMEGGNAPDVAALNAKQIVLNKDETQVKINDEIYRQWYDSHINTASKLNSWASQFADLESGTSINNLPYFSLQAQKIFKSNMALLNGDVEGATKMTKEGLQRSWGTTNVNGKPEFVFSPIEKILDLDNGAIPLIHNDLYEQIKTQIAPHNAAYEEGKKNKDNRISFRYELEERPSWDDFRKAQNLIARKKKEPNITYGYRASPLSPILGQIENDDPELTDAIKTFNNFKNNSIKIKQLFDGGHIEEFTIAAGANPGLQQDPNSGVIGSYNVSMRKNNGPNAPMTGWFKGPLSEPVYMPNQNQIRQRYFEMVGLNSSGKTLQQIHQEYVANKNALKESGAHPEISQIGRGFR